MSQTVESSRLIQKLDELSSRFDELQNSMNDPAVLGNPQRIVAVSKEAGKLEPVVRKYRDYRKANDSVAELRKLIDNKSDREMSELAESELPQAAASAAGLLEELKDEFLAADDNAVDSFFLELRAGTGGEEAALFSRDLYEMYRKYVESHGWRFEVSDF
jgi:peptide chain release factor 1